MLLHEQFTPGLAIVSHLVGDEKSGEAVVVDPTRDVEPLIEFARRHDLHIRHVIETHIHADFVSGSRELKSRLHDAAAIHCSGFGDTSPQQAFADQLVTERDQIEFGALRLGFRHVPGHTPEHLAVLLYDESRSKDIPWLMFSGDFLFVGDVGRPDLLGEQEKQELAHELHQSVFERVSDLPDFTEIFPTHGSGSLCGKAIGSRRSSTLGFERRFSAALQRKPEATWVRDLLADMPLSPRYFKRMKQVNAEGPRIIGPELPGLKRVPAKQVRDRVCDRCLTVDVRSKEAFAASHIPGAINIPRGEHLPGWAGWVLPDDRPILLVAEDASNVRDTIVQLLLVGFDAIEGYLEGGMEPWETSGFPLARLNTLSVHELSAQLQDGARSQVLDVRTEKEWSDGHIDGATHIHGGTLQERLGELAPDAPLAVVCGSGYRASIAASVLQRAGFESVSNVIGGMTAWKAAKLPTV